MPQETNLNVYPYFDDYNNSKDYHKVLFKPAYPVQARELTTLQSILQAQVERFGTHIFTDGSKVLGGQLTYNNRLDYVILEPDYFGADVVDTLKSLNKTTIVGRTTGVRAEIIFSINRNISYLDSTTIYVKYLSPGTDDARSEKFIDGEVLEVEDSVPNLSEDDADNENIQIILRAGQGFALTRRTNSTGFASSARIESGVFFIRGFFINVGSSRILLDQYRSKVNFKVGLRISEDIITADQDSTLNDNSNGFSNFAAPGADRFKVSARLDRIDLNETETNDFITITEIRDGEEISANNLPQYSEIASEFARRTFDESGNYYVKSPNLSVKETLNNYKGNNGVFSPNRETYNGNTPSESLGTYVVSPTKAYVQGFEVKTIGSTYLDFEKPRTTKSLENENVNYFTGPTFTLNRVYGSPKVGFSTYFVSLHLDRVGSNQNQPSGKEIGLARVYDFALESGSYSTSNPDSNEWDISLYDVQTYAELTLNEPITLETPTYIKGNSSGAAGFLRYDTNNSGIITAYNVTGNFLIGETFTFDGIKNTRICRTVNSYGVSDVKSLYGIVGSAYTFTADVKQKLGNDIGLVSISSESGGRSIVSSADVIFTNVAKVDDIVAFTNPGQEIVNFAQIEVVNTSRLTIIPVESVSGICSGSLPTTNITPSDFRILKSSYQRSEDNTLYTQLPKANVSSVDLSNSDLIIRKQYDVTVAANSFTLNAGDNLVFLPFDEERYCLVNENGLTEELTQDKVDTSGSSVITISGLTNNGNAKLIATLRRTNIKEKVKDRNTVNTLIVSKSILSSSGIGTTTLNDGLEFGNYPYGTRVQDDEICLNQCEVTKIHGIYESSTVSNPTLPSIVFSSISGPSGTTSDLILGEEFIASESNALGIYVERNSGLNIGYSKISSSQIAPGEVITFKESGITAVVSNTIEGSVNIMDSYTLNKNEKNTIYDYSKIVRKENKKSPIKKIKIVFEAASFSDSDSGDITTKNSYDAFDYCDLSRINGVRTSDIIDIRPRVPKYTVSEGTRSPLEFLGRGISANKNSSKDILASDESFAVNFSYYLPRIDKIYLSKDGKFQLSKGEPSETPRIPSKIQNSIEIAKIDLPAYLCNIKDAKITLTDYKRYQMADIKRLEDRIKNLEYYTSLTVLESETANLQITDADGLNRFKSGFFVDDFSTTKSQKRTIGTKNCIDIKNAELRPSHYSTEIDLILGSSSLSGIGTTPNPKVDARFVTDLIGLNVTKTGQLVTLDYQQTPEIIQKYSSQLSNVSAYSSSFFSGTLDLFPASDVWVDQIRVEPKVVNTEGNYVKTELQLEEEGYDQQAGFSPTVWNSWETIWTGENIEKTSEEVTIGNEIIREDYEQVTKTGTSTRTGKRKIIREVLENTSFGDQVLDSSVIPYLRSRNIEFTGRRLKPFAQLYSFFDGVDVNKYVFPKLIKVTMLDGTFEVGEDVIGYAGSGYKPSSGVGNMSDRRCGPLVTFRARVAQINHKFGPYDSPTQTFIKNPYDRATVLPDSYSTSTVILNIDTFSLANKAQGEYFSRPNVGMVLTGRSSRANARVESLDLFTDQLGDIIGCFWIPNPNVDVNPKFESGTKVFRLTSSSTNSLLEGTINSAAEEQYYSEGKVNTVQENIIVTRNSRVDIEDEIETQEAVEVGDNELVSSTVVGTIAPPYVPPAPIPETTRPQTYYSPSPQSPQPPVPPREPDVVVPSTPGEINRAGIRFGGQAAIRLNDALDKAGLDQEAYQGMPNEDAVVLYNNAIERNPTIANEYSFNNNTTNKPEKNSGGGNNKDTKKKKDEKLRADEVIANNFLKDLKKAAKK